MNPPTTLLTATPRPQAACYRVQPPPHPVTLTKRTLAPLTAPLPRAQSHAPSPSLCFSNRHILNTSKGSREASTAAVLLPPPGASGAGAFCWWGGCRPRERCSHRPALRTGRRVPAGAWPQGRHQRPMLVLPRTGFPKLNGQASLLCSGQPMNE